MNNGELVRTVEYEPIDGEKDYGSYEPIELEEVKEEVEVEVGENEPISV